MYILAVDTSGNVCSAAVLMDERILSEIYVDNKRTHSETLATMADECLRSADKDIKRIDLFCCSIGPGSFTGIRIGAGMIKALSHASGKPAIGVNTLDALSINVAGADGIVCPIIDARRGEVYTASYSGGERITDYRAEHLDNVLSGMIGQKTVFLGDAAVKYHDTILGASDAFRVAHPGTVLQRAGSVGIAAFSMYGKGLKEDAYSLEPFYLRETQAERLSRQRL